MRLYLALLILILLGLGWQSNVTGSVSTWLRQRGADALALPDVEKDVSTSLEAGRRRLQVAGELQEDVHLQQWLRLRVDAGAQEVNALIRDVQSGYPEYQQVAVMQSHHATVEEMLAHVAAWTELGNREFTHAAVVVRPFLGGLGWHCCVIVGQRLPVFSPEGLSGEGPQLFYSECSLCKKGLACQIPRHTRSLSLLCPSCHRTYAVLASGSDGKFRYVNEFLTGYAPPARFPKQQSRLDELMTIWRAVSTGCHYTSDTGTDDSDAWQTARETQALGQGDCEDSAILLADWLLARGFEARICIGRFAERGGHAWVVVRLEGAMYLLESTQGTLEARQPPLLKEVGSRYVPEVLFDRASIYVRRHPQALWNSDFWSEQTWERIVPREKKSGPHPPPPQTAGPAGESDPLDLTLRIDPLASQP